MALLNELNFFILVREEQILCFKTPPKHGSCEHAFFFFFCLVWRRVNAGGFELVGGWGTCCSFSRYTTVSLLFSFLLSPPSHLPPIFHPTLVHFLLFSLLCLDEWFSKGKIFPVNFEKCRPVLYLMLLTQNNKITREIRDFHVMFWSMNNIACPQCLFFWLHVHNSHKDQQPMLKIDFKYMFLSLHSVFI